VHATDGPCVVVFVVVIVIIVIIVVVQQTLRILDVVVVALVIVVVMTATVVVVVMVMVRPAVVVVVVRPAVMVVVMVVVRSVIVVVQLGLADRGSGSARAQCRFVRLAVKLLGASLHGSHSHLLNPRLIGGTQRNTGTTGGRLRRLDGEDCDTGSQ